MQNRSCRDEKGNFEAVGGSVRCKQKALTDGWQTYRDSQLDVTVYKTNDRPLYFRRLCFCLMGI